MSKGSKRRPPADQKKFDTEWDRIFKEIKSEYDKDPKLTQQETWTKYYAEHYGSDVQFNQEHVPESMWNR